MPASLVVCDQIFLNKSPLGVTKMSKTFVTNRENKGQEVILGKYVFTDGVMVIPADEDAAKMAPLLINFYGVTMEDGPAAEEAETTDVTNPSLEKSQTVGGGTGSEEEEE
jgi:hypothetical protein